MSYDLDELDRGIIKFLAKDGRMSFTELASKMEVTEKTVRLRYKNLVDQNILEVVGVVNPVTLGIKAASIIQLGVEPNKLEEVTEAVMQIREVRFVTMTSGEYQLLLQINVPTQDEIRETLYKINKIDGVNRVNSIIQFDIYKNTFEYI